MTSRDRLRKLQSQHDIEVEPAVENAAVMVANLKDSTNAKIEIVTQTQERVQDLKKTAEDLLKRMKKLKDQLGELLPPPFCFLVV